MFALHMGWRHLLFASWPVDPDLLEPRIPDGLAVDTRDGRAWLSVVPYVNVDVRPRRLPRGTGFRLPELNLRTYVTLAGDARVGVEDRPAVYFFSLDAGGFPGVGLAGVVGARLLHHLPYYYADVDLSATDRRVRFESHRRHPGARPVAFAADYGPTGESVDAEPRSLAAFLTERYRYYTEDRRGGLRYADIDHEPWPLARADAEIEENTLFRANGFDRPDGDPVCYYSPGVDVVASRSRTLRSG